MHVSLREPLSRLRARGREGGWMAAMIFFAALYIQTPWGASLDRLAYDSLYLLRGTLPAPDELVIVAIDEDSFSELSMQWPWPRSVHAALIDSLFEAGAKVVALDIIFAEPSTALEDRRLRSAIEDHSGVILATDFSRIEREQYVQEIRVGPALSLMTEGTRVGNINFPTDADGFIRRLEIPGGEAGPMAFESARLYDRRCCALDNEQLLINFLGPPGHMRTVSYYQAMAAAQRLPADAFRDKLVFVGLVTHSAANPEGRLPDQYPAPYSRWGHGYVPGVEIHATAAANLLYGNAIRPLSPTISGLAGVALASCLGLVFLALSPRAGVALLVITLLVLAAGVVYLFSARTIYLPAMHIALPVTVGYLVTPWFHYRQQFRQRRFIESAFSTYVAAPVVQQLIEEPERLQLGGQTVEASILFLDVAGFTSLSEQYDASELVQIMNRFLDEITGIVVEHNGMIDKFIGDAVMGVWGVPLEDSKHAAEACAAALAIARRIETLGIEERSRSGAEINVRLGINSGPVVAGNIGGSQRFDYTVLGNDVNLASRLEGVNKFYGTQIIIGENSARLVGPELELRELDVVRVKGKKQPVRIYELQGWRGALAPESADCKAHFERGLAAYRARDWAAADRAFRAGLARQPDDGPCRTYLERLDEFARHPPPVDWDGVYDMTSK